MDLRYRRLLLFALTGIGAVIAVIIAVQKAHESKDTSLLLTLAAVTLALSSIYNFLRHVSPAFRNFSDRILKFLTIYKPKEATFSDQHKKDIKKVLLTMVKNQCKERIREIEQTFPSGSIPITFKAYDDFNKYIRNAACRDMPYLDARIGDGLIYFFIAGAPGNGKSYSLLRWISDYIHFKEKKEIDFPIPVFVPLSTWTLDDSMETWLPRTLEKQFSRSPEVCHWLLKDNLIIPCLDGLDEVDADYHRSCLASIVDYAKTRSVVCTCRSETLKPLLPTLDEDDRCFIPIYELNLLRKDQIKDIVALKADQEPTIVNFLDKNAGLLEYLETPLMLNLFLETYHALNAADKQELITTSQQEVANLLWGKFDLLMFTNKSMQALKEKYPNKPDEEIDVLYQQKKKTWPEIRTYMLSLADHIQGNTFFIEQLQPSWLSANKKALLLYYLTSRLLSGLLLAIAIGCITATPFAFIHNAIPASIAITLLTLFFNGRKKPASTAWTVLSFCVILLIITGIYQGMVVPRKPTDMSFMHLFSWTDAYSGITLGIIFGVLFGYRKIRQDKNIDIQPLEIFVFNRGAALRTGLRGGLAIGIFIACAGVAIKEVFPGCTFYLWLQRFLFSSYQHTEHLLPRLSADLVDDAVLFFFGFMLTFVSSFLVFALMAGRDPQRINLMDQSKKKKPFNLNFGIRQSLKFSLLSGFIAHLMIFFVYGSALFFFTQDPIRWIKAFMIGLGMGIISFLWFGGFEIIQHWSLRFYLYLSGILPWRLNTWIRETMNLAFIQKTGSSLHFLHYSLIDYLKSIPAPDPENRLTSMSHYKHARPFLISFLFLCLIFLSWPFANRYLFPHYWQKPNEIRFAFFDKNTIIALDGLSFIVKKPGILNLTITGTVIVGTFTGYTGPEGAHVGFLGFPLGDVYNPVPTEKNGSLLYQRRNDQGVSHWVALPYHIKPFFVWTPRTACLPVQANDTISYMINDDEWQNNTGHFSVQMSLLDTCRL